MSVGPPVEILPYDPAWRARFEAERAVLEPVLAEAVVGGIHHVGSTAVPGLAAKPIIDILSGVIDLDSSRWCVDALVPLGYVYAPYRVEEMHWLCKPDAVHRTHHLHLVPADSARFADEISFRDALRADPELAADYSALKHRLAERFRRDREGYTAAKADFIRAALRARSGQ